MFYSFLVSIMVKLVIENYRCVSEINWKQIDESYEKAFFDQVILHPGGAQAPEIFEVEGGEEFAGNGVVPGSVLEVPGGGLEVQGNVLEVFYPLDVSTYLKEQLSCAITQTQDLAKTLGN